MNNHIAPIPSISTHGNPQQCGNIVGRATQAQTLHSLKTYRKIFELCDISWNEAIEKSANYRPIVKQYCPHLLEELQGLADDSDTDEESLFALNCRTEILPANFFQRAMATDSPVHTNECTSLAFARNHAPVWLAQNWDWVGLQRQSLVVVAAKPDNNVSYITVTEAGMLAKIGLNDRGLGVTLNILRSHNDGQQPGMPVHFLLRSLLELENVQQACEFASRLPYASSSNILLADRTGEIASLEVSPAGCKILPPDNNQLCHTNHFLHQELITSDAGLEGNLSTTKRLARTQSDLSGLTGFDDIKSLLSNTSDGEESICRFADTTQPEIAQTETVVGVAMNLTDNTLWVSGAQPSISEFAAHKI